MANARRRQTARPALERLEGREVPAATPWLVESFEQSAAGALPTGWAQHNSDPLAAVQTTTAVAQASAVALRASGSSQSESRAWLATALPADAQVGVSIYLDSLIPAKVIARGQALDADAPTYYAVSVTRGLQLQLLRVVNGETSILQTLNSGSWISGQWVRVSLTVAGDSLKVQVFRTDTAQYLAADGTWQTAATQAISARDTAITGGGFAGLGRSALYSGDVHFDNFVAAPPSTEPDQRSLIEETFARPAPGGLPTGWQQWTGGNGAFQVSTNRTLTYSGALTIINPTSDAVRAWNTTAMPADVNVDAAVFVDSLAPAQMIARGRDLNTDSPSYYAVSVTRGLELQLLRVVNGQTTVLKTLDSQQWLSGQWVHVTLSVRGDDLRVLAYRNDTGQYLDDSGEWRVTPVWAMEAHDSSLTNGGLTGLGRAAGRFGTVTFDSFTVTTPAAATGTQVATLPATFDDSSEGSFPAGWGQYSNTPTPSFSVTGSAAASGSNSLSSDGGSDVEARAWLLTPQNADTQVSANVYLGSLVPLQVLVRGSGLDTATPSYYAVSVTRGTELQLLQVVNGQTNVISTVQSNDWVSGTWAHVNFLVQGNTLQVQFQRLDTGEYLTQDGNWQADPAIAISATDSALTGSGFVGVARPASYSGPVYLDDFNAAAVATPTPPAGPPPVTSTDPSGPPVTTPPVGTTPDGIPAPTPPSTGTTPPPGGTTPPPTGTPTPPAGGTSTPPVSSPPSALPSIPHHYSHIRIAEFAYYGTPMGAFEQGLLQNSVDLVIPNTSYIDQISAVSPQTPQFIYSNASNIYRELFTDWLNFADAHGYSREAAFYHVNQASPFTGDSASSWPVEWFWNVQTGADGAWADQTSNARSTDGQVPFGALGQAVVIGNTEEFREINVTLDKTAGNGWAGALEYATAVDAQGNPTAWKKLNMVADGTNGFRMSGRISFDPPADWVTASVNGTAKLYFARIRTTADGDAPLAQRILGRDYVGAKGSDHGVIPAFDKAADRDGDGYLNDSEYANRRAGMDARFVYESRVTYPNYGQNRFATNVANMQYREWAADYSYRFLQAHPNTRGLFMDNSLSKIAIDPKTIAESLDHYADNYAEVLAAINAKIAPKWVLANVAGGGTAVDALAKRGISYLEEFAIRPLAASYSQFEDVASNLARRLSLSNGKSYAILDSLATNGSMTDARVQIGTLAYYYLLADPNQTMLMFNGGNDPNSTWAKHWSDAVEYDVGNPKGAWSTFATGKDPANATMIYKVYQRTYDNALVLYKPLSYYRGVAGTTGTDTATTHALGGTYRPLNADGTLGAAITRITLRNGEGAILVKV